MQKIAFSLFFPLLASAAAAGPIETEAGTFQAVAVAEGLDTPWAFDFLPDGTILVTLRDGALVAFKGEDRWLVENPPKVLADGQGGLLDVMVPRDFAQTRELFFTYSKRQFIRGSGTAVYKARLSEDGRSLTGGETIFEIARGSGGGFHFGSRLVESPNGTLFVTVGDRGSPETAQDLGMHNGSVLHITKDGDPAPGNPGLDGLPEIYSYGHRNPQGAALDASGQLWTVEHGAKGGDEVNRIAPGLNFGWPVISYGVNYNDSKIGEGTAKDGMEQPEYYWDPSIAPSGMTFFEGGPWDGNAFIGSLKFSYISRLAGDPLREVERIEGEETGRVRDVAQGPDGKLWWLSVFDGVLYRLE